MNPRAFRIRDFRSIVDSGVWSLSGDNITVLAGQNEAGKTAVLTALRDFDLEVGEPPETQEFLPEDRYDAKPRVAVEFEVDGSKISKWLDEENKQIPEGVIDDIIANPRFWIERDLSENIYNLDERLCKYWEVTGENSQNDEQESEVSDDAGGELVDTNTVVAERELLGPSEFAAFLREFWPNFIYFDSFQDMLPRDIPLSALSPTSVPASSALTAKTAPLKVPQPVLDFIELSELDLALITKLQDQDKSLANYLQTRSATITGDFLTYWTQKVDGVTTVDLQIQHKRDSQGVLKLAFYVFDRARQYPEQRSKGFLWFLSFYLRLAAAEKREPNRLSLLLIDEPGSYLHARAQQDVLSLFEDRIAKNQHVIYSTHSPFLLPSDRFHRVRVVIKKGESGTRVLDRLTHPDLRGDEFADTLSPFITAVGIDVRNSLVLTKENNLLVEGLSDYLYLHAWAKLLKPEFAHQISLFPGFGAPSLLTFSSLFIGWGLNFSVLLDRDDEGNNIKQRLEKEFLIESRRLLQPQNGLTIEDMFELEDFYSLLRHFGDNPAIDRNGRPSAIVRKLGIDKVLLARKFSELVSSKNITMGKTSEDRIKGLFDEIEASLAS